MNLRGLSFEAMPPLIVPYRFFISAPLSIIAIGLLWLFSSPEDLASRWSNFMLATTHGITLGFMLMVMFGALFQVLPVVTGIAMPQANKLARLVHLFLVIGVVCLLIGFAQRQTSLLATGAISTLLALIIFAVGLLICFPQMRNSPTSWAIRLATIGLLITVGLGVAFIIGWLEPSWFPSYRAWTNIHLMWGMLGWTLLLVMGVSFQIIPMFYVTPDYPRWVSHFLPATLFIQLLAYTVSQKFFLLPTNSMTATFQLMLIAITVLSYAVFSLYLIGQRKRKALDVTLWFWKFAMISLLIAAVLFVFELFYQGLYWTQLELILAAVALVGFAMALITGMILKIVPFLVWLNIQQKWIKHPATKMPLSNMQQVIPIRVAKRQFFLFITILPILVVIFAGLNHYWLIKIAGLQLIITYSYLFYTLLNAKTLYQQVSDELDEQLEAGSN